MTAERMLWHVLIPLLVVNSGAWAIQHWYWTAGAWLVLAILGKRLFLYSKWAAT